MDSQTLGLILTVIGVFVTVGLSINAFFLRGIFVDLNDLRVRFAEIATNGKNTARRIDNIENNMKEVFSRLNNAEKRIK